MIYSSCWALGAEEEFVFLPVYLTNQIFSGMYKKYINPESIEASPVFSLSIHAVAAEIIGTENIMKVCSRISFRYSNS